jgi:hypothetical protein
MVCPCCGAIIDMRDFGMALLMQVSFRVDRSSEILVLPSLPHLPVYLRDEQDLTGIDRTADRTPQQMVCLFRKLPKKS